MAASCETNLPRRDQAPTRHRRGHDPASRPSDYGWPDRPGFYRSVRRRSLRGSTDFRPRRLGILQMAISAVDDGAVIRSGRLAPLGCRPASRPRTSRNDSRRRPGRRGCPRSGAGGTIVGRGDTGFAGVLPDALGRLGCAPPLLSALLLGLLRSGAAVGRGVGLASVLGARRDARAPPAPTPSRRAPGRSCGRLRSAAFGCGVAHRQTTPARLRGHSAVQPSL